jgi:hypothetical protein
VPSDDDKTVQPAVFNSSLNSKTAIDPVAGVVLLKTNAINYLITIISEIYANLLVTHGKTILKI